MALRRPARRRNGLVDALNRSGYSAVEQEYSDEADQVDRDGEAMVQESFVVKANAPKIPARARRSRSGEKYEDPLIEDLVAAGLPRPERNWVFAREMGRRWALDIAWPQWMLAIEVEGGLYLPTSGRHNRGASFEADSIKYNTAALLGWVILRFGPKALRTNRPVEAVKLFVARRKLPDKTYLEKLGQWGRLHPK